MWLIEAAASLEPVRHAMSNSSSAADPFAPRSRHTGLVFTIVDDAPRGGRSGWLASAMLGFSCFMAVVALLSGVWARRGPTVAPVVAAAPPTAIATPRWVDITRPLATFDLAGGPYAKLPVHYEARRLDGGSARQDTITYGVAQPGESFARLLFDRHGADPVGQDPAGDATLFVDAARLAAGAGLAISHSALPWSVATRFGTFETAEVTVGRPGATAACVALRRMAPVLSVTGLMCGSDARAPGPVAVACMLDKLDLVSAGDDLPLRDIFVAAERQRGLGCIDAKTARPLADDPLRPLSAALRGSLPLGRGPGSR